LVLLRFKLIIDKRQRVLKNEITDSRSLLFSKEGSKKISIIIIVFLLRYLPDGITNHFLNQ
jgi:hypothetical protein